MTQHTEKNGSKTRADKKGIAEGSRHDFESGWNACLSALSSLAVQENVFLGQKVPEDDTTQVYTRRLLSKERQTAESSLENDPVLRARLNSKCAFSPVKKTGISLWKLPAEETDAFVAAAVLWAEGVPPETLRRALFSTPDSLTDAMLMRIIEFLCSEVFSHLVRGLEAETSGQPVLSSDLNLIPVISQSRTGKKPREQTCCVSVVVSPRWEGQRNVLFRAEEGEAEPGGGMLAVFHPQVWVVKHGDADALRLLSPQCQRVQFRLAYFKGMLLQFVKPAGADPSAARFPLKVTPQGETLWLKDFQGIIDTLNRIETDDRKLVRRPAETDREWLKRIGTARRRRAAPLMHRIRELLMKAVPETWYNGKDYDLPPLTRDVLGLFAAMWLNDWDRCTGFIDDPRIPVENDGLVPYIRFIATLVNANGGAVTKDVLDAHCVMRSLIETGRRGGIKDIVGWLAGVIRTTMERIRSAEAKA